MEQYVTSSSLFSVEDQVISRAWRLGASRAIHVEVLAMAGTVEEHMLETAKVNFIFSVI